MCSGLSGSVSGQWSVVPCCPADVGGSGSLGYSLGNEAGVSDERASTINVKRQPPRAALVACRFVLTLTLSV